jgi:signal transduction histidine kinase
MRIATRLTLLLLVAVAVVMAGYGFLRAQEERQRLTDEIQQEVLLLANAIKLAVEQALRDRQPQDIQTLLAAMVRDPNPVDRIRVFDLRLEAIVGVATEQAASTVIPQAELEGVLRTGKTIVRFETDRPRPVVYTLLPLRLQRGGTVGVLEVVHVADRVQRQIRDATRDLIIRVGLLSLTIALVIWLTVRISIRRPVASLVRAALALGRGNFSQRINIRRRDEIGQLAGAFNRMAQQLQAAHGEIMAGTQARLELERQVQQAQKLAVMGRLASEVAHEIGTPLNIISGRTEMIQKGLQALQALLPDAETILRQVERIGGIMRQLLEYARPRRPAIRPVATGPIFRRTVELLEPVARQREVHLEVQVPEGLPPLLADPDQLQQVLLNLVTNALDATPPGGQVRMVVSERDRDLIAETTDKRPRVRRGQPDESHLILLVADTGSGMPRQRLDQIFEPFFSTKGRAGGTGLGLPIVEDIVLAHRGAIEVRSAERAGTTVLLRWPMAAQKDRNANFQIDKPKPATEGPEGTKAAPGVGDS